jgi:hypothetical protein
MPAFDSGDWKEIESQSFAADDKHAYGYRFAVLDREKGRSPSARASPPP